MKKKRKSIFRMIVGLFVFTILATILFLFGRTYQSIKRVENYQPQISSALEKYQMQEHENLVKAIILTESRGNGVDLMQSSESAYGQMGAITTQEGSIDQGVKYLSEMIAEAKALGCDLATAIQAYNFGKDYIAYVNERGGKNTVRLAEEYSRDVLSPLLGNDNKKTYRYWRIQSLLYNGGYLYHNGGNMFYADVVKMNQQFLEWYENIF
ncbi:lysozyme family protein [Enterococcus mundtii]|uniref:lysozyme family protein n=1 Tax=Enterococcus TaxID=1350 RepID=UPI000CF0B5D5|nr:lysozyme family protein [Enterococcus mundtii]PQC32829.1 transglycosylase SLT domain protein [Enterococcus mundtii]